MHPLSRVLPLATLAAAAALPLQASPIFTTYSSQSSFNSNTDSVSKYTFPLANSDEVYTYPIGPFTFQRGPNAGYFVLHLNVYAASPSFLEYASNDSPNTELVDVSGNHTAVAFQIGGGDSYSVDVNGQLVGSFSTPVCNTSSNCPSGFFGVTSDVPITSVAFTTQGADTDTLFVEAGSAVPEPSTLALLGTGALAAAGTLRRRLASR